ncbi:hypothetical protein [Pseudoxanthomonas mexicana]
MLSVPIQVRCDDIACFVAFLGVAALRLLGRDELLRDVPCLLRIRRRRRRGRGGEHQPEAGGKKDRTAAPRIHDESP